MEHGELKTHLWNLSRGLVAGIVIAACGPQVVLEGETDTDPTVGGEACESTSDCPAGQRCAEGQCIEESCGSGGCCYGSNFDPEYCYDDPYDPYDYPYYDTETDTDSYYDTDTTTNGLECYSSADCSPLQVCSEQNTCEDVPALPPCADGPQLVVQDLPTASEAEFVSLAFVNANGDAAQDLVVGRSGAAELVLGPGDAPPIVLPVNGAAVTSATAGDLDGDGDAELVLSTQEGLVLVLTGDGAGSYVELAIQPVDGPLRDLTTLQWDGDQLLDVVGRVEGSGAVMLWGDATGGFADVAYLATAVPVISLARGDLDGDAFGDVVLQDAGGIRRFQGSESGGVLDDGIVPNSEGGSRTVASAAIDPGAPFEVVGVTYTEVGSLVELWPQGLEGPQRHVLAGSRRAAGMGDFDGDGLADLMVGGDFVVDYVRAGEGPSLSCTNPVESPAALLGMAVGDLDGNGRADVVIASARGITLLASQ